MLPIGAPIKLRKTTPEEAALTAKNYRLAKELVCFADHYRERERREAKTSICILCEKCEHYVLFSHNAVCHVSLFFFSLTE